MNLLIYKSRKTKCDGREKRNVIFEAKTKCAQKSRLLPLSSQNTSVVQTPTIRKTTRPPFQNEAFLF